jgi:hypothetical protein
MNGGKLKLKVMSETSSPHADNVIMNTQQINQGNHIMNHYFKQNKHNKFAQIDSPKDSSIERVR